MIFETIKQLKLSAPPTALCVAFNKVFVATKSKKMYVYSNGTLEPIVLSTSVTTLCNSEQSRNGVIYCGGSNGRVIGLNECNKAVFKANTDTTPVTGIIYDSERKDVLVSNRNKKIYVFGENALLKNTMYCSKAPIVDISLGNEWDVSYISENSIEVQMISFPSEKVRQMKSSDGFPSKICCRAEGLVVGYASGCVKMYDFQTGAVLGEMVDESGEKGCVTSMINYGADFIAVGYDAGNVSLYKICNSHDKDSCNNKDSCNDNGGNCTKRFDKIASIKLDGIPIAIVEKDGHLIVAVSREHRFGRWGGCKNKKNKLVVLSVA